jgi:ABC-type cobalamin/Fe3+-siderophores transport system ATPase subunit
MKAKNNKLLILDEPTNYIELIYNINSNKWLKVMKSKMDFMYINQVWMDLS